MARNISEWVCRCTTDDVGSALDLLDGPAPRETKPYNLGRGYWRIYKGELTCRNIAVRQEPWRRQMRVEAGYW